VTNADLLVAARHLAERDLVLAPIIAAVGPPMLRPNPDLFASLANSIVGQQLSVKAAAAIRQRLVALMPDGGTVTPGGILARSPDELRGVGLSRTKAAYLLDLAAKVRDGAVDLASVSALDDEAIIAELVQVKGIGRWTVEMFLIFALNRLDVLPVADLGFRNALMQQYGLDHLPAPEEIRELAAPWAPYRSVGTWYMWQSLRITPVDPESPIPLPKAE
jgi:DNA-3-methyladenine glycosylase II